METDVDLTIIFYTCNRINERFAAAVRAELLKSIGGRFPIVCVSHQLMEFGDVRVVVGDVRQSIAQVYRNILAGCEAAETTYCAAAEDDALYTPEHFDFRPPLDTFCYNESRWILSRRLSQDGRQREGYFFFNPRTQMAQGVFARELMISALTERFARHPDPPLDTTIAKKSGWGEPGRYEKNLRLAPRKLARFQWTQQPNVIVNHAESLMGRRQARAEHPTCTDLAPWGNASNLWRRIHGDSDG